MSHWINDDYLMTHILSSLPEEYSTLVDHAKIDWRSKALMLIELMKRSTCYCEEKMHGLKMKWLLQQAKTVQRTKVKVQIRDKP